MTMPLAHSPAQNNLLAALLAAEDSALEKELELVPMRLGDMVYEPGQQLNHAYFPTTSIVSLHYVMATGAACETSSVGNEGVVGVPLFTGGKTTSSSAVVHTAGHAYRLRRAALQAEFDRHGLLHGLLLRYVQALITQTAQTAACNRYHTVEQQLCRWLLMTLDRVSSDELVLTQELIASRLGVRREGITAAAGNLQRGGCINYRRGHVSVVDRARLEARTCECYAVVKSEMTRLATSPGP